MYQKIKGNDEAKVICDRLIDRHNKKCFKNYINFDEYVDKN